MAYIQDMRFVVRFSEIEELRSEDRCDCCRGQEEECHDGNCFHAVTVTFNHMVVVLRD